MSGKFNAIYPKFRKKLSFWVYKIEIGTQKIDNWKIDNFGIVIASFSIKDKEEWSYFVKKNFLLADISMNFVLKMFFLILNNVEIDVVGRHVH